VLDKKAEAYRGYGEAALLELVTRMLPDLVRAAAEPLSSIDTMTVISTDGASALARSVASTVAQGLQIGTDVSGVDLAGLLSRLRVTAQQGQVTAGGSADGGSAAGPRS
jgi:flotillin